MKKKIITMLICMIALASILVCCAPPKEVGFSRIGFSITDEYDTTGLMIYAGDTRELTLLSAEQVTDDVYAEYTFEIDHVNTLYDTGDITIEGRDFIVPADTLDIVVSINVLHSSGSQINPDSRIDVEVINDTEGATQARVEYEQYFNDNNSLYEEITGYQYALLQGENEIVSNEESIEYHEEIIRNTTDPEVIKDSEKWIKIYNEEILRWREVIALANEQYPIVEPKFDAYVAELDRLLALFHQPIKGGLKQ